MGGDSGGHFYAVLSACLTRLLLISEALPGCIVRQMPQPFNQRGGKNNNTADPIGSSGCLTFSSPRPTLKVYGRDRQQADFGLFRAFSTRNTTSASAARTDEKARIQSAWKPKRRDIPQHIEMGIRSKLILLWNTGAV